MIRVWVVNASPLILLGKIGRVALLSDLSDELIAFPSPGRTIADGIFLQVRSRRRSGGIPEAWPPDSVGIRSSPRRRWEDGEAWRASRRERRECGHPFEYGSHLLPAAPCRGRCLHPRASGPGGRESSRDRGPFFTDWLAGPASGPEASDKTGPTGRETLAQG
jgi:hypothetical protein